jgi:hypothetical protein
MAISVFRLGQSGSCEETRMRSTRRMVLALLAAGAVAGCSSSSGPDGGSGGPTITSFTAAPTSLPSGGGSVTLAWTVTGATSLSIDPGVGTVTPVTTGTTSTQVTAATTFTLTATSATGSSTQTASVTLATPQTVSGKVVDNQSQPVAALTVIIASGSFSASAVSGADGTFSVANVPMPYNATLISSNSSVVEYVGLTRTDPTLTDLAAVTEANSSMLSGTLSGGNYPESADYSTSLAFSSPQTSYLFNDDGSGGYAQNISWSGPSTTTGALYALQVHTVSGLAANFPGYGSLSSLALTSGTAAVAPVLTLSAVTNGTVGGTVTPASGYTLEEIDMFLQATPTVPLQFLADSSGTADFSYVVPSISGTSLQIEALAHSAAGESSVVLQVGLTADSTGVSIAIPAAPILSLPVDVATNVTVTTPFSWTAFSGGVHVLSIYGTGVPHFDVITAATTATLPDLVMEGISLPASANYSWQVIGFGPNQTVDGLAGPGGIEALVNDDFEEAVSLARTFTTASP